MSLGAERLRLDAAVSRLPRWLAALGVLGTLGALRYYGLATACAFLLGAAAAWVNLKLIEQAVDRIGSLARSGGAARVKPTRRAVWMLVRFVAVAVTAFVILGYSGISIIAAFCGFLVCPAAVIVEIVYELVKYEHS
ncbi:MAG: hypothetical protein KGN84_11990 [Acidobacteriota bacterium]|nr:hypothetical protein [Acidobacteriota bacterium]